MGFRGFWGSVSCCLRRSWGFSKAPGMRCRLDASRSGPAEGNGLVLATYRAVDRATRWILDVDLGETTIAPTVALSVRRLWPIGLQDGSFTVYGQFASA